jgi:hypothetical protein
MVSFAGDVDRKCRCGQLLWTATNGYEHALSCGSGYSSIYTHDATQALFRSMCTGTGIPSRCTAVGDGGIGTGKRPDIIALLPDPADETRVLETAIDVTRVINGTLSAEKGKFASNCKQRDRAKERKHGEAQRMQGRRNVTLRFNIFAGQSPAAASFLRTVGRQVATAYRERNQGKIRSWYHAFSMANAVLNAKLITSALQFRYCNGGPARRTYFMPTWTECQAIQGQVVGDLMGTDSDARR